MEDSKQCIDFIPIINSLFSINERKYILESGADAKNRFFLLWTRKEALLKALGTGIVSDLTQIEVFDKTNKINKKLFDSNACYSLSNDHVIYSKTVLNYFLSIAITQKTDCIESNK